MADRRWLAALVMLGACDKDGGPNAGGTFHLEWAFFPETGRTCGDVGIAQVEASIKPFDGLPTSARFPCTDAAGDTGDFPPGVYGVTVNAVDGAGVVQKTARTVQGQRITSNQVTDLGDFSFDFSTPTTGSISVIWSVNGGMASTACPTNAAISFDLDLNTPDHVRQNLACTLQVTNFTVVPVGVHTLESLLVDGQGTHLSMLSATVTVMGGVNAQVLPDFVF